MSATLKSEIPGGGIRSQNVESDFADYVAGRPTQQRVVLAVVQTNSVSSENQTKGRVNKVKYEVVHLIEVRDSHEADQIRHRITQLRADAGLQLKQPALFDLSEAEQCEQLIDLIRDHASANDQGITEIDKLFHDKFGGGDAVLPESFVACRAPMLLKELAFEVGAIPDSPVRDTADLDEDEEPSEDETSDDEASGSREPVAAGGVPFSEVTES